jgi:hypothetical protein
VSIPILSPCIQLSKALNCSRTQGVVVPGLSRRIGFASCFLNSARDSPRGNGRDHSSKSNPRSLNIDSARRRASASVSAATSVADASRGRWPRAILSKCHKPKYNAMPPIISRSTTVSDAFVVFFMIESQVRFILAEIAIIVEMIGQSRSTTKVDCALEVGVCGVCGNFIQPRRVYRFHGPVPRLVPESWCAGLARAAALFDAFHDLTTNRAAWSSLPRPRWRLKWVGWRSRWAGCLAPFVSLVDWPGRGGDDFSCGAGVESAVG